MTEYFMTRPFPQPEVNQTFWFGTILFAGILLTMVQLFIHRDQQQCAENTKLFAQRQQELSSERRAAIVRMSSKQANKAFRRHYGNVQPLFNPTRFGHIVMFGINTILVPVGFYGTILGFISLNL